MAENATIDEGWATIDARGLKCPLPVLQVEKWAREKFAPGALRVLVTDPVATGDIPALAAARGWTIDGIDQLSMHQVIRVTVPVPPPASTLEDAGGK